MEYNKCYNCRFFDRYFTRGYTKFDKTDIGRCYIMQKVVNKSETCDNFKTRRNTRRENSVLKITLENLLDEISEIRKMIESENDESADM